MNIKLACIVIAVCAVTLSSCSKTANKTASGAPQKASSSSATSSKVSSSSAAPQASSQAAPVHESTDQRVINHYTQASKYYTEKDYTSAVKECNAALALDPLCYQAYCIKGAAQYYSSGDPQQGFPLLEKCLQINPNYQFGYFNEALIYKGEKNWDKSIALFNKVIEIAPDNAWAYYGISTIYADRNMVPQSLEYLKKAISVDPSVKETARVQDHYDRMRSNPDFQALVK